MRTDAGCISIYDIIFQKLESAWVKKDTGKFSAGINFEKLCKNNVRPKYYSLTVWVKNPMFTKLYMIAKLIRKI